MRRLAVTIAGIALAALLVSCGGGSGSQGTSASAPPPTESAQTTAEAGGELPPGEGTPSAPTGASVRNCETQAVDAEGLRATAVSCGEARATMFAWQRQDYCAAAPGASHSACSVRGYRCIGTVADAGLAVSCARAGRTVNFTVKRS